MDFKPHTKPHLSPEQDMIPVPSLLLQPLSSRANSSTLEATGTHPVPTFAASPMGGISNIMDLDPEDIQREQRKAMYREGNPFKSPSSPARARSMSPRRLELPIRLRYPLDQSLSTTFTNQRVVLPPINGARCGPGIPSPSAQDGQPRQPPSLPPLAFDPSAWPPPLNLPSRHPARDFDIEDQVQDTLGDVVHQSSPEPDNTADQEDDNEVDGSSEPLDEEKEQNSQDALCEFAMPCRMNPSPDGMHYRKVISHIFGRNKATTKLFPAYVWVHYCRKHYQRARYRADQWPFTQCELLLESLRRMEDWDGVESFKLTLRRREQLRVDKSDNAGTKISGPSTTLQTGRKHPTAIISPVPDWLRRQTDTVMSFDDIRALIMQIREYMVKLRNDEKSRGAKGSEAGENGNTKNELRQQASRVRFPDIEILPFFKRWVVDAALRQRDSRGNGDQDTEVESDDDNDPENAEGEDEDDADAWDDENDAPVGQIGRTGTNSGRSESQRRRSQRNFVRMVSGVNRVSRSGAVKKPNRSKKC